MMNHLVFLTGGKIIKELIMFSVLAKDIMTIHVSTISFESTFSLSGRLLDDRHRSLTPAHVERLSLIKDWEQADAR
jgi:hypothetical protein